MKLKEFFRNLFRNSSANSNSAVDESFEAISFDQLDPDDSMILTPVIEVRPITFRFDSSHDSPSTSRQGTITFQHSSYKQIFNKPVPNSADQAQNISEVCPSTSKESSRRLKESSSSKSSEENEAALDEDKLTSSDEVKPNKNFKDFFTNLEYEILCSICSEYLIKATTLMCSHTFCAFCIRKWQKTRRNCPMCNARIDLKMYTLTLDRIIERFVEYLPPNEQARRNSIVQKHTRELQKAEYDSGPSSGSDELMFRISPDQRNY